MRSFKIVPGFEHELVVLASFVGYRIDCRCGVTFLAVAVSARFLPATHPPILKRPFPLAFSSREPVNSTRPTKTLAPRRQVHFCSLTTIPRNVRAFSKVENVLAR